MDMDLQLGACQADAPEILEQCGLGIDLVEHDAGAVEVEAEGVVEGRGHCAGRRLGDYWCNRRGSHCEARRRVEVATEPRVALMHKAVGSLSVCKSQVRYVCTGREREVVGDDELGITGVAESTRHVCVTVDEMR